VAHDLGRLTTRRYLATYPKLGIITIAVWQWTPFMMLVLLAGLQSVPEDVREAARVDGRTR
jgi:ABC-type sugar transport system permease subunit